MITPHSLSRPDDLTQKCAFCGAKSTRINTYKHYWSYCPECGNAVRFRKDRYMFDFVPKHLFFKLPKGNTLFLLLNRKKDKEAFYDYYLEDNQVNATAKGTKWEGELDSLTKELLKFGISLKDKKVLDISGGPGFLAQDLKNICKEVVVTEYSQVSVERMKNILKLKVLKFDYDSDEISKIINDKFDIVLIRYSINFCKDIKKFLSSLKKLLHNDSIIYVSFVPPTLGVCLRWQFDDYIYNVLYSPETLARLFSEEGLIAFARYEQGRYYYLSGRHFRLFPFIIPYRFLNQFKNCNKDLYQKNIVMIFKKNPNANWY
jgi:2-polyprenyl-3-methyl-5-hydroxy-6-metoxy-1,4-benzoquinol methylase/predicted RNA-binding Zn-ribbon protein involved in translation (DUF1610 family)